MLPLNAAASILVYLAKICSLLYFISPSVDEILQAAKSKK